MFKRAPHLPFDDTATEELGQNALVIRVQPDEGVTIRFGSKVPGAQMEVRDVTMDFGYGHAFTEASPEAYERLILDVLLGDPPLFPRHEEVELSWKILDPIEDVLGQAAGQPEQYAPGGWGPAAADEMMRPRRPRLEAARDRRPAQHHDRGDLARSSSSCARRAARSPSAACSRSSSSSTSGDAEEAIEAANDASREHPCASSSSSSATSAAQSRLDAQIRVGGDAGASEVVVLRAYGALADHGRASSPAAAARRPRRRLVADGRPGERRPTTRSARWRSAASPTPPSRARPARGARAARGEPTRRGDTDLAWTRLTLWRALLAAALDQPPYEPVTEATVAGRLRLPVDRPAGRLAAPLTLRCPVRRARAPQPAPASVSVRLERAQRRRSTWSARDGNDRHPHASRASRSARISPPAAATARVPRRRAAPARPRRDLRGDASARAWPRSARSP